MGARTRRGDRIRRCATWLALAAITALLVLPALAFAAENVVVTEYKQLKKPDADDWSTDDGWIVIEKGNTSPEFGEPYFSASSLRGADGQNGLDWSAGGEVRARIVGRGYRSDKFFTPFTSFEDFAARSSEILPDGEDNLYRVMNDPSLRVWRGARKTTLGGLEAYVNRSSVRLEYVDGVGDAEYGETWVYWIPAGDDSGILVTAWSFAFWSESVPPTRGEHYGSQLDPLTTEVEEILASLKFIPLDGTAAGAGVPGTPGGGTSPWRTVTGGMAAVVAAAVALAGAAASTRAKTGAEEPAPDQAVGYVLQLSTGRLTVSAEHSATFTARAFKVLPNGQMQPASDAAITLNAPAGVGVSPASAQGTLTTTVWQTGDVALGSAITVEARSPLGTTTASVPVAAAGISRIVTRIEPASTLALSTQGGHSITLIAVVELLGADAAEGAVDPLAVQASIAFDEDSEWLDISIPADYEGGRAVTVVASQPDPTNIVQPPEGATIRVTAQIGERPLTELVTIPLAGLPELEVKPAQVTLAAESGGSTEVAVSVTNGGDAPWQFDTLWREGSRAIASADIAPTGPTSATLTLTEDGGENLDPTRPQTASTLVVLATADGYDEIRRHVDVIVTQEGLFIDRTNVDPSTGAFALAADGTARPTAIDLRVFVRDPSTGEISPDIGLAQAATLDIGGQEGTSGHAGLRAAGLTVEPAGVRQLNIPSATFSASLERKLPTAGESVPAALLASVPGYDSDRFSALVPLRLIGVDMEPFSAAWETERDNCLDIIRSFVPFEHQERLYALVAERSLTMGAEGLFHMRKQIWSFAHDQIMKEKHEHLDAEWWYQQIEDTLDWVSWCGDIALGVASGAYVGVVGSIAIGMLKPLLVSAMEVWLAGGGLDDWLLAQTSMLTGVLEGAVTDPDFLAKLGGDKKAIGYALFIAYYFAKELYNDPQMSVTNAMKNVGRQLRDEGLIMFLRKIAGMRGITPKSAADAPTATRKPAAASPDAPRAKTPAVAPDAPRAKTPPAAAPDAAAPVKPKPETSQPENRPRPKPDADAETVATKKTPEAETQKPTDKPGEKKTPEKTVEKAPEQPAESADPRRSSPEPKQRAKAIADDIAAKTKGGGEVDLKTAERIMRDPDAMRELKKSDPEAWKKFHKTRAKAYEAHDAKLKDWIEDNVPDAKGKDVTIESFGTPDGVDRDYRAGYKVTRADGTTQFIELKKEKWAGKSAEIFAKETGGPSDPAGAQKWAKDHQQLATDQYHAEASVDMADQATVYNEKTKNWEKRQVTPNVDLVKDGKSTLLDPDGYGKTYETKVAEAYHEGNVLDAYKQADKAVHSLEGVQDGYAKQHYGVKDPPPMVKAGMDVIKDVQSGKLTTTQAETKLKDMGHSGGLPDFMEKLSGQFASLKWARKA